MQSSERTRRASGSCGIRRLQRKHGSACTDPHLAAVYGTLTDHSTPVVLGPCGQCGHPAQPADEQGAMDARYAVATMTTFRSAPVVDLDEIYEAEVFYPRANRSRSTRRRHRVEVLGAAPA